MKTKIGVVKSKDISFPVEFGLETLQWYQKTFKRNLEKDLERYEKLAREGMFDSNKNHEKAMQIVWAFAKTANPKIKRPKTWIKQFRGHSSHDIFKQTEALLTKGVM